MCGWFTLEKKTVITICLHGEKTAAVMAFGDKAFGRQLGLDELMRESPHHETCALIRRGKDQSPLSFYPIKIQQEDSYLKTRKNAFTRYSFPPAP